MATTSRTAIVTIAAATLAFGQVADRAARMPDGKPNLVAPAPRTPDGKPDLTGIWGLSCPVGNAIVGGFAGQPNVYCATEVAIPPEFGNIGQALKDGLPYQPWAAELVKRTRADNRPNDPLTQIGRAHV